MKRDCDNRPMKLTVTVPDVSENSCPLAAESVRPSLKSIAYMLEQTVP